MESSKIYTTEEVEKIKQKVLAYKNVLTTLKLGASLEDYLSIKNEFEELKMQMVPVDFKEDAIDENPPEQIEQNDNQVEQVSVQLASLNRLVEEVLSTLNKVAIGEVKKEQAEEIKSPLIIPHINEERQPEQQVEHSISQPTYIQLRNLIGQSVQPQNRKEPVTNLQHTKNQLTLQQQRHFTSHYFQSVDTQPTNIYNGLYRNMRIKVSSKLKNMGPLRK